MTGVHAPLTAYLGTPSGLKCPRCGSENCESYARASRPCMDRGQTLAL